MYAVNLIFRIGENLLDKKRALICSIILYAIGIVTLIIYLVGSVILKTFPSKFNTLLPILFTMFFLAGTMMTGLCLLLKKQEKEATVKCAYVKPNLDDEEFRKWLTVFELYTKTAKKLNVTTDKTFSKFGGMPDVPKNFIWPMRNDVCLPFLLQIDFAEINGDGALADFPQNGIMYLFVDSDDVNAPEFEYGEEPYAEGRTFKILYFDGVDGLTSAQKPDALGTVYKEFNVSAEAVKTYPDTEDCREAFDIYCNRPVGGMDDAYDYMQGENMDSAQIGGWASYIQGSSLPETGKTDNNDEWVLLMQLTSYFGESLDDNMMWGDAGNIYMFIRKTDLQARNFNNVKFDMQCT